MAIKCRVKVQPLTTTEIFRHLFIVGTSIIGTIALMKLLWSKK